MSEARKIKDSERTVEMSISMTPEINNRIMQLSEESGQTLSRFFSSAVSLYAIALQSREEGNRLIIVDENDNRISQIEL